MTRTLFDQPLDLLERRFQALQERVAGLPEASRQELETALQEVSLAVAALRADREAGESPPAASPSPCEAMLRHVFNAIPDLLTVHDRDFNTIMSNWHGYESVPEAERQGHPKCYRVYHHRDLPCDDCHALKVLGTGQPVKVEKVNPADGRVREVSAYPIRDESGRVILVVEHVRDLTEGHLAAEGLRASEGRFRTLIEDSPESLFLTDVQGTVLAASRVAAQRLGKELPEVVGRSAFEHLPPEVASRRRVLFEQVIATGRPVRIEDARGELNFDINFTPIPDADGKVSLLSILAIDITDRKHAEQALKESEGRFRMVFEHAPDAYYLMDFQGNFLDVNRYSEEISGYDRQELIGKNFQALPLLDERQIREMAAHLQQAMTGEIIGPLEYCMIRKDGRQVTMEAKGLPIKIKGKNLILVIARDITARKQAEAALRESEELYRSLFENMLNGFSYCKMFFDQNQPQDFIYLDVNRSFEALTGLKDVVGKKVSEIIPGLQESNPELLEIYGRVALTGKPERFETYLEALKMWFSISVYSPAKEYFVAVFDVITARKQAEAALRESEATLRTLIEANPEALVLMDTQGMVLAASQVAARRLGKNLAEIIGADLRAMFPPKVAKKRLEIFQRVVASGQPMRFDDVCEDIHHDNYLTPIFADNQVVQVAVLSLDITARKQTEEALRESEERYRMLFEAFPDAISLMDIDMNMIVENPCGVQLFGSNSVAAGTSSMEFVAPEDRLRAQGMFTDLLETGQTQTLEIAMRRQDGSRFPGLTSLALVRDVAGRPQAIIGIARDITALKQAEAALAAHLQFLQLLLDTIPNPIFFKDAQGAYLGCNKAFEDYLGVTRQEIVGKSVYDLSPKELADEYHRMDLEAFQTTGPQVYESRVQAADGAWRHVVFHKATFPDPTGGVGGLVGIIMDITGLKQAEAELRQSEQRFRLMAETIQDVFWMATPEIGRTLYVSPAYEQTWGRPREELYGNPQAFAEAIHPEDRERVRSEVLAGHQQGAAWGHEYRIIKPDGTVRWIQDRGFPVRDDQGRVIMFTGVATDVTEHKALEAQLLQAQKMEAVGRLAGGVAHDFNNLLMAITGYGELMRAKVLKDDPLYGYLENILKAGDRAAALTQQLLTFSRQKIAYPQVVDLNRVVLDLEPMLRRLIGEDLHLEVVTGPRLGAVKADPGQLGQIIMNLVVNARDAMPQGGRLTLKTAPVNFTVGCHNRFGLTPPGPYVMLEVQDTGVGMDEATQAHVFEPFFTTKEPGKGTGLGLSTVYGVVKQSGGYLDLASETGAGSTFTIYLPRLEAIVSPPKAKIPITASFRGEETVLLVEDEDVLRGLLTKFLRLYGYAVLEARHGGEALLTCERHQGPIHLLVTDVVMPQMSGRELAGRLSPLRPEMKVLYMSGYTEDTLVQHGVADLSVAFLQKPFRPIELARRVYAVLHPPVSH